MALLARLFGPPKPRDPEAAKRIKAEVRAEFQRRGIDLEDGAVTVSEIVCNDPACPGFETVILVLRPRRPTRAIKLAGAMDLIATTELIAAIETSGALEP